MKSMKVIVIFSLILSVSISAFLCMQPKYKIDTNHAKKAEEKLNNKTKKENSKKSEPISNTKTFKISAAGDCTIGWDTNFAYGNRFDKVFKDNNEDYKYFFKNVLPIFKDDDITYVNLEGTFTNNNVKVEKRFNFKSPPSFVNVLKEGNVEVVGVANNHTYDYGNEGFNETKDTLDNANIDYFGYDKYLIKEVNGIKVGFFGLIDIMGVKYKEINKAIQYLKDNNCDLIIAAMHWGIEKDYNQSNEQIKMGHYMIDHGVDLVLGSHPHVIQGIEKYNDKYIVYSLANFVFGGNSNPSDKDTFIFQQTFTFKDNNLVLDDNIKVIPASISSTNKFNNYQPTPATGERYEKIKNKILSKSVNFSF